MSNIYESWVAVPKQKRKQLILLVLGIIVLGWILWQARVVLWPFLFGLAVAYILAPFVDWLSKGFRWIGKRRYLGFFQKIARPLSIVLSYLIVIAVLVGFFALIVPLVVQQARSLWDQRETIWEYLTQVADDLLAQYQLLPTQVQQQIEDTLGRLGELAGQAVTQAAEGAVGAISYTISLVIAIAIIPFWTFYLLKDSRRLGDSMGRMIPSPLRRDVRMAVTIADRDFGSFLRGQLLMMVVVGVLSGIGYSILGVNFAVLLGVLAGVFEVIPNLGPFIGAFPAVLVALTQNPILALWTALLAFGIQQIETLILAPRILGESVQLHPVLVMVVLVIGSEIGGLFGLLLAPVITAVLRDLFRYFYYRFSTPPLDPDEALARVHEEERFSMEM